MSNVHNPERRALSASGVAQRVFPERNDERKALRKIGKRQAKKLRMEPMKQRQVESWLAAMSRP